jgi:hypothetical protein
MQYCSTAYDLASSPLRRKLLTFFTYKSFSASLRPPTGERWGCDSTNLSRELARLASEGWLRSATEGRQRNYSIDPQHPYLKAVFRLLQGTAGIIPTWSVALYRVPGIEDAYLDGSFAKNQEDGGSDIDC